MEIKYCKRKGCGKPIDAKKRSDSIYCSPECGWRDRNEKKRKNNTEKREAAGPLEKNYKIMKNLYERGFNELSKESLLVSGFDFETYTGIAEMDVMNNTTEYKLFEFFFKIDGDKVIIKKLNDGCI